MTRERTYGWQDPAVFSTAIREKSGLDFLGAIGSGDLPAPPANVTTGIVPQEVGDGYAIFTMEPAEWQYNPLGTVHGGILSTLADTALGCAVHTRLPVGVGYTSLDLVVKFTRAVTMNSGVLTCEGRVVTMGRRAATAEARITDVSGRVVAHATTTCLLIREEG
jgi:uncharacterized protein (TIGR00369 family)